MSFFFKSLHTFVRVVHLNDFSIIIMSFFFKSLHTFVRVVHLNDFFKLCNTWIGKIVHMVLEIKDSTSFNDFLIETDKSTFLDFPFFCQMYYSVSTDFGKLFFKLYFLWIPQAIFKYTVLSVVTTSFKIQIVSWLAVV